MKFLSVEQLGPHRYKTKEGYLICTDAIIARTGKQQYKHSELFEDSQDEDSIIEVDRPYAEVFNPETIASFENKPLCDEHPEADVTVDNHRDLSMGYMRDIHKGTDEGQDVLMANLVITDPEVIAEIENGEKNELSCGYDCQIMKDDKGNYYQHQIRGNHLALCKNGRAGNARIQDSKMEDEIYNLKDLEKQLDKLPMISFCYINGNEIEGNTRWLTTSRRVESDRVDLIKWLNQNVGYNKYQLKYKSLETRDRGKEMSMKFGLTLNNVQDSVKDDDNIIDRLIADEEEAIKGYEEAMKNASERDKALYSHIITEELEHIEELKNIKELQTQKVDIYDYSFGEYSIQKKSSTWDVFKNNQKVISFPTSKEAEDWINEHKNINQLKSYTIRYITSSDTVQEIEIKAKDVTEAKIKAKQKLGRELYKIHEIELNDELEIKDVNPNEGESKEEFIHRFMKETKSEYPDEKQRFAVANSYWERKGKNSLIDSYHKDSKNVDLFTEEQIKRLEDLCKKYDLSFYDVRNRLLEGYRVDVDNHNIDMDEQINEFERVLTEDSIRDDYSSFLGNYGFDYLKGSGDYEHWYLKYDDEDFNKLVQRIRKEYPMLIISSSPERKTIYIQKSKYKRDSIHDSKEKKFSKILGVVKLINKKEK